MVNNPTLYPHRRNEDGSYDSTCPGGFATVANCPRCKCKAVLRAHRRGLDWLMPILGFRPARCFTCNRRFYMRHSLVKAQQ
jgi:hypothetical protein